MTFLYLHHRCLENLNYCFVKRNPISMDISLGS